MSMIRKYHNHKLQTTPWHREEEPLNHHETPGRQIKQSNQLSLPHQDDCNTKMDIELGTNVHKHRIETGNAPPQRKRPYRVSPHIKQQIDEQVEDMLKNDIIEPSDSFYAASVVMCKKKDGTYRFAVDYRDLNAVTEPINFPFLELKM